MLNNYLVWKLMDRYDVELSWEYVHASREFYVDRYGIPQFLGTWMYCFRNMDSYLGDALSSMYVRDHFVDENKQKVRGVMFDSFYFFFSGGGGGQGWYSVYSTFFNFLRDRLTKFLTM